MTQKSVLITGSSSGLGYDAAHGLRARGWRVFAACRQQHDCDRLIAEGFESPLIDYADPDTIYNGLADVLEATGGTLDALYNNGAFAIPGATQAVIPVMRNQGHGRIINCSSVLGIVGMRWRGAYVATKFALEGLTDVLRIEMADTPIKIILLEPGPITSKIRENAIPHFEHWIDHENSARRTQYAQLRDRLYTDAGPDKFELPASATTKKIIHALESKRPKPRYYVTFPTYLMGTLRRILPTRALDWVIRKG